LKPNGAFFLLYLLTKFSDNLNFSIYFSGSSDASLFINLHNDNYNIYQIKN